jgi:hypothetical protein
MAKNTPQADDQGKPTSQAGALAVPAAPALAAPDVPVASAEPAGNQAQVQRYRESVAQQLFPGWRYPPKLRDQDKSRFDDYLNDIRVLKDTAQEHEACGRAVLKASQKIYDDELARRESINKRGGAVLNTGGILGALFVAAGQLGLIQEKGRFGVLVGFLLAAFIIALLYVGSSIIMALAVQGQAKGSAIHPSNISRAEKVTANRSSSLPPSAASAMR